MAFKSLQSSSWKSLLMKQATSSTIVKWDWLEQSSGLLERITSSRPAYIAMESSITTSDTPFIEVMPVEGVTREVDTTWDMSQSYVGTKVIVTDHGEINENDTSSGYFIIDAIVGATTDRLARGRFIAIS